MQVWCSLGDEEPILSGYNHNIGWTQCNTAGPGENDDVVRVVKPHIRVPRNKKDGIRASTVRLSLQITYAGVVLPRGRRTYTKWIQSQYRLDPMQHSGSGGERRCCSCGETTHSSPEE